VQIKYARLTKSLEPGVILSKTSSLRDDDDLFAYGDKSDIADVGGDTLSDVDADDLVLVKKSGSVKDATQDSLRKRHSKKTTADH